MRSSDAEHYSGNFHALILFKNDKELQTVSDAVHRLVHRAIRLDGTCEQYSGLPLSWRDQNGLRVL